jgi:hypothetical protein
MGVWGAKNLQNDHAADYFAGDILAPLKKKLQLVIDHPRAAEPDNRESAQIMVAVEVLAVLCEQMTGTPPKAELVARCRDTFLRVWDEYIDKLQPSPEFKAERRGVIVATFDRLLRVAEPNG